MRSIVAAIVALAFLSPMSTAIWEEKTEDDGVTHTIESESNPPGTIDSIAIVGNLFSSQPAFILGTHTVHDDGTGIDYLIQVSVDGCSAEYPCLIDIDGNRIRIDAACFFDIRAFSGEVEEKPPNGGRVANYIFFRNGSSFLTNGPDHDCW